MKHTRYFLLLALVVALASCHSQQKLTDRPSQTTKHKLQLIDRVVQSQTKFTTLQTQKARISLNYGQKTLSASATINLYHDSTMIVSVQPLLGIELFRMEVNKNEIIVIDKLNRRFARVNYESIYQFAGHRIEFNDIESLLTACAFVVGKNNQDLGELKFKVTSDNDRSELKTSYNEIDYSFSVANANLLIQQTMLSLPAREIAVEASYINHQIWDEQHTFPQTVSLTLNSPKINGTFTVSISQIAFNKEVDVTPCNLKKYQQTALINLIK